MYFLRKSIKNNRKSMLFDTDDYQWIKSFLKEYSKEKQDYYPNNFYQITLNDIDKFKSEIKNIGTLTLRKWAGQSTIIVGCGHINVKDGGNFLTKHHYQIHDHEHNPETEYLVDPDITILPDMCIAVCEQSLSAAMPEAYGKIKKISVEGICLEENDIFFNDCKLLLADDGIVCTYCDQQILIKKNGELYFIHDDDTLEIYKPWTLEDVINKTFGYDIFDWKGQYKRNGWRFDDFSKNAMCGDNAITYIKTFENNF
jgi:DNA-directed RNA polymerase subunit RPC12/RpoP